MAARDRYPNLAILAGTTYSYGDRNEPLAVLNEIDKLEAMLTEMVSEQECIYDSDDRCWTHHRPRPCVHERVREMLGIRVRN